MQNILKNKAVSAGVGYTAANLLAKGVTFLSIPLFSRMMTPEQFGVYNVFASYDAIVFILISMALHASLRSAHVRFEGQIDRYVSSVSLLYLLNTLVCLLAAAAFGDSLSRLLGLERRMLYLLPLYSFGTAMFTLFNTRLSIDYDYKRYLLMALASSAGNIAISLALMTTIFSADMAAGRILGATISYVSIGACMLALAYRAAKPRVNLAYWKYAVRYSLPIIPHGISQVLLAQFDRIMIANMVGSREAGIYSLAGNIKLVFTILIDSISNAWTTWFYERMALKAHGEIQRRAAQLCALFAMITVGAMALSPEGVWILGGDAYMPGKYVAIPMLMDAYIIFLYNMIVPSEYYTEKTVFIMIGTTSAAAINVIANYIFIGRYGYLAAAYTTLFAYVCYLLFHMAISHRLVRFFVAPPRRIALCAGVVALAGAVNLLYIDSLAIRLCAGAALIGVLGADMMMQQRKRDAA